MTYGRTHIKSNGVASLQKNYLNYYFCCRMNRAILIVAEVWGADRTWHPHNLHPSQATGSEGSTQAHCHLTGKHHTDLK